MTILSGIGNTPLVELWQQAEGRIDAFVHAVSTAHSIHGVARALRRHAPSLQVTAVEPAESAPTHQVKHANSFGEVS